MDKTIDQKPYRPKGTENMTDEEYRAWKAKEIKETKRWADENPDKMISERDVWKILGFEY